MSPMEQALLDRWATQRDAEAFAEIVSRYSGMVYATCCRILGNSADAQDITQECFLRLAQGEVKVKSSLAGLLHSLATSRSLNLIRSESRRRAREVRHAEIAAYESQTDWARIEPCIDEAIAALPDDLRNPLIQHFFEGKTHQVVAESIGISRPATTLRIGKGIELVRKALNKQGLPIATAALTSSLAADAAYIAPTSLAASLGKLAISGVGNTSSLSLLSTGNIVGLIVGAKVKIALVAICLAALGWFALPQFLQPTNPTPLTAAPIQDKERETDQTKSVILKSSASSDGIAGLMTAASIKQPEPAPPINPAPVQPIKVAAASSSAAIAATTIETATNTYYPRQPSATESALSGFVFDLESGAPIPGAIVRVGEEYPSISIRTKTAHQVVTNDMGIYKVYTKPGKQVNVIIGANDYVTRVVKLELRGGEEMSHDFRLEKGAQVVVRVVDEKDAPIKKATVDYYEIAFLKSIASGRKAGRYKTNKRGEVVVHRVSRAKPQHLAAQKSGYEMKSIDIKFAPGEMRTELRIVLKRNTQGSVFRGIVRDNQGSPLRGVAVVCTAGSGSRCEEAKTGVDGHYSIQSKRQSKKYYIRASKKGWVTQTTTVAQPKSSGEPFEVDIDLEPGHWLAGTVYTAEKIPAYDIRLIVITDEERGGVPSHEFRSRKDGRFKIDDIPAGEVNLILKQGRTILGQTGPYAVDADVEIILPQLGVIKGRVFDAGTQKPVPDFTVKLHYLAPIKGTGEGAFMLDDSTSFSSDEGRFAMEQMPLIWDYNIVFSAEGYKTVEMTDIKAKLRSDAEEMTVYLKVAEKLSVLVVDDKSNQPLAGVSVIYGLLRWKGIDWSSINSDYSFKGGAERCLTLKDGIAEISQREDDGTLFVNANGYERKMITPAQRSNMTHDGAIEVRLGFGGSVTGHYFKDGKPTPDVRISLRYQPGLSIERVKTDKSGRFQWDHLPAGSYEISVCNWDSGTMAFPLFARNFDLQPEQKKEINLGDGLGSFSLSGNISNEKGEALRIFCMYLEPDFEWTYGRFGYAGQAKTAYRIEGLRAGRYNVIIKSYPKGGVEQEMHTTVEIQENTEHDFIMQPQEK
jgi:RNA polymerase sigma factor (sigma-70 family)